MDKLFLTADKRINVLKCLTNVGLSMLGLHIASMAGVDVHHVFALPVTIVGLTYIRELFDL